MTGLLLTATGVSARITSGRLTCLYRGNVGLSFALSGENPYTLGTLSTLSNSLTLASGEGCGRTGSVRGSFELAGSRLLAEVLKLELTASPPEVTRAQAEAAGGVVVTFTPTTANVRPTTGGWRTVPIGGWSTDITPCLTMIVYPAGMCQITITGTNISTPNALRLFDATGVVGLVIGLQ